MTIEYGVTGLKELRAALKTVGGPELERRLPQGLKRAADVIIQDAIARIPEGPTGAAQASLRSTGGATVYLRGGGPKAPYYGWLDFGTRDAISGRPRSVGPWKESGKGESPGRYLYPAIRAKADEMLAAVADEFQKLQTEVGL